ncbi:MAG: hypothetical protein ACRENE_01835 [Polyangiaceae bacterium]
MITRRLYDRLLPVLARLAGVLSFAACSSTTSTGPNGVPDAGPPIEGGADSSVEAAASDANGPPAVLDATSVDAPPDGAADGAEAGEAAAPCGDINENCCWGNVCGSSGLSCVYSTYYGAPRCVDTSTASGGALTPCGALNDQCCPSSEGAECSSGYQCYIWQTPDSGYPTASSQCEPSTGCGAAGSQGDSLCSTYYGSPATGAAFVCYGGSTPTGSNCRQVDEGTGLGAVPGPENWCCQSHPTCIVRASVGGDCVGSGSEQVCTFGAMPSSSNCAASMYSPTYCHRRRRRVPLSPGSPVARDPPAGAEAVLRLACRGPEASVVEALG